jgi:hypothetical protein
VREEFRIADGPQGGERRIDPGVEEGPGFIEEAGRHHRVQALVDAAAEFRAGKVDREDPRRARQAPLAVPPMVLGERQPRDVEDLERAVEAKAVVGVDARRGLRVDVGEQRVQAAGKLPPERGDPAAQPRERGGRRTQPLEGRPEVEPGAADEERGAGAGGERWQQRQHRVAIAGGAEALGGVGEIDQVVAHARALRRRRLRGPDVEPAIDLAGIAPDDFGVERLGEEDSDRGLAARRRADERDRGRGGTIRCA